ncbi:hypothetical protein RFI_05193 [Reticulomyxa filosa]|uniref:Uncharacterized protein n=1 Tax=Reticulomyxa filosa TaxID=46433 RepID=X6P1I7_RETFI|nr:hypothetical protein RFI_05193 [Reticulomyxa filosa]|eukprot:ETO31924.1 hypothetical protein RFI_05193 [Reticulomyxa filosa]
MAEEIPQVHNNSKKRIYLSCVIMFVRVSIQSPKILNTRERQHEENTRPVNTSNDEIKKKAIEDKEREREEEAEVNKNEDENEDNKAGHGRTKSTVANFFGVTVGDQVRILGNKTCVMWSFPMKRVYGKWYDLLICFEKKKSLISVEFCFNIGYVKFFRGKEGVVKCIGETDLMKGSRFGVEHIEPLWHNGTS